jgi:hypothetical protein
VGGPDQRKDEAPEACAAGLPGCCSVPQARQYFHDNVLKPRVHPGSQQEHNAPNANARPGQHAPVSWSGARGLPGHAWAWSAASRCHWGWAPKNPWPPGAPQAAAAALQDRWALDLQQPTASLTEWWLGGAAQTHTRTACALVRRWATCTLFLQVCACASRGSVCHSNAADSSWAPHGGDAPNVLTAACSGARHAVDSAALVPKQCCSPRDPEQQQPGATQGTPRNVASPARSPPLPRAAMLPHARLHLAVPGDGAAAPGARAAAPARLQVL